jgi:hypothetical protein
MAMMMHGDGDDDEVVVGIVTHYSSAKKERK